jgi:hypothetical protein
MRIAVVAQSRPSPDVLEERVEIAYSREMLEKSKEL